MQAPEHPTHLPSLLLFLLFLASTALLLAAGCMMTLAGVMSLAEKDYAMLASAFNAAAGAAFCALLLAPPVYFSFQRMKGNPIATQAAPVHPWRWVGLGSLLIWSASIVIGNQATTHPHWGWLVLPIANLAASGLPVVFLAAVGLKGIETGPRWRSWGVFGLGMTAGPLVMMGAELVVFLLLFIFIFLYIGLTPGMLTAAQNIAEQLQMATSEESILLTLAPVLNSPLAITLALFSVAICVPIVEELLKPFGIWLFARSIRSPRQGFGLGILSGAAYALLETLGVSSQAGVNWATLVIARCGTSLLHILTTGLTSWALVSAWQKGKFLRLAGVFTLSVSLHAVWNALNIINVLGTLLRGTPGAPAWLTILSNVSMFVVAAEAGIMLVLLGLTNFLLREPPAPVAPQEAV